MKVLNVIQRYPPAIGGAEVWCRNICRFLAARGVIVKVATINLYRAEECWMDPVLEDRYIKLGEYDNDKGVFIRRYHKWSFGKKCASLWVINFILYRLGLIKTDMGRIFRNSPHSWEMYRNLFWEIKEADIVHLHTLPYFHNIAGYYMAKICKKKIVITPHFHPGHKEYEKNILFKIMNNCDAVIAVSGYEKDYLGKKGVNPKKIFITGNTLLEEKASDNKAFDIVRQNFLKKYEILAGSKKILFIGRKESYKGIGYLIKAAEELVKENDIYVSLFLVGPDIPDFRIENQDCPKDNKGKLKIIDFGTVSDIEKEVLLEACDMLVLPSQYEAFGIVFLEAWKYGKPVIGSNIGAVPDVIKDAGLCVEYGNISDLKNKMKLLLSDGKFAAALGRAGKKKVEGEYSLENIGAKVFNIYRNLNSYKKRVLIVSNFFPPHCDGGAEIVAYEQAKQLKDIGFDIRVFSGKVNDRELRHDVRMERGEFDNMRINFHAVDYAEEVVYAEKSVLQEKFRNRLYDIAPDVVHFHNTNGLPLEIIEDCCRMNIPTVMTLHDYRWLCFKQTLVKEDGILCDARERQCLSCEGKKSLENSNVLSVLDRNCLYMEYLDKIDLLISPSRYLAERFIDNGVSREKLKVINNGIDIRKFDKMKRAKSKKIRFGFIGSIREHKGVENLLEAISLLRESGEVKFSLTVAGKGESLFVDYFKRLIRELGLSKFVYFLGEISNKDIKRKVYENIDVLIVPSVWPENSPVTIMEALAAGTPVLASDIGGIPELIQDGVEGYLHRHDDVYLLMKNLKNIINNPDVIGVMREACLKRAHKFNIVKQVGLIADEYSRLMGRYD